MGFMFREIRLVLVVFGGFLGRFGFEWVLGLGGG